MIDINGGVSMGKFRLEWIYSENVHRRSTIEELAQRYIEALRSLIKGCRVIAPSAPAPSDFDLVKKLSQRKLNKILATVNKTKGKASE